MGAGVRITPTGRAGNIYHPPGLGAGGASGMNRLGIGLLSMGHFTVDLCQGALPILLPLLVADLALNYTEAAFVVAVAYITSSILQPLLGYVADRLTGRWLLPVSCAVACAGLALAGQAPAYPVLLGWVVVSSLGVAMYHPEAARLANRFAGARKTSGMSLFAVGGNLGFAVGPVYMGLLLALAGRPGGWSLLLPAVAVPLLLIVLLPRPAAAPSASAGTAAARAGMAGSTPGSTEGAATRRAVGTLIGVFALRQLTQAGLLTFIQLYFVTFLGQPAVVASQLLTALQIGSVVGTLAGGPLADRFGRKAVIAASLGCATPLLLLFLQLAGPGAGNPLAVAVIFLAGAALVMTISASTVLAQELIPNRTALAAGLTIGLGAGIGGAASTLFGGIADTIGIGTAMALICLPPFAGALLTLTLPARRPQPCLHTARQQP